MSESRWMEVLYECDVTGKADLEVQYATGNMDDGTIQLEITSEMPIVFLDREQAFNLAQQLLKYVAKID